MLGLFGALTLKRIFQQFLVISIETKYFHSIILLFTFIYIYFHILATLDRLSGYYYLKIGVFPCNACRSHTSNQTY
jgi:hypothetical protein